MLEGDVGLGFLEVRHNEIDHGDSGSPWERRANRIARENADDERNDACATAS